MELKDPFFVFFFHLYLSSVTLLIDGSLWKLSFHFKTVETDN